MRDKSILKKRRSQRKEQNRLIREAASDILTSENFRSTKNHIQHGTVTVNSHCINVARHSLMLAEKLGIRYHRRELIRGALLHDYFLYDWHDKEHINPLHLHGFFHPGVALKNASAEYDLTEREREIIRKHMWPLTVVPPMCREAWIVTAADKWVSLMETLHIHKGSRAKSTVDKGISD
ncbi:MAG: HD domain-containing protein [Lachnospiraceae bacterium]|nr:HD domain-containing protein [Lachnospiraceae bacterium]